MDSINRENLLRAVGITLKRYRNECNFSQLELSNRSGLSKNTISDIESGKKCPTIETLFRIFVHFEKDIDIYIKQVKIEYIHLQELDNL